MRSGSVAIAKSCMGFARPRMVVAILRTCSRCLRGPSTKIQGKVRSALWRMVLLEVLLSCKGAFGIALEARKVYARIQMI
jgi:hypothetical protein